MIGRQGVKVCAGKRIIKIMYQELGAGSGSKAEGYRRAYKERREKFDISGKVTKRSRGKVELGGEELEIRAGTRERENESKDSKRSDVIQRWNTNETRALGSKYL